MTPEQRKTLTPEQMALVEDVLNWVDGGAGSPYLVCVDDPYDAGYTRTMKSPQDLLIEYLGISREEYLSRKRAEELDRLKQEGAIPEWLYEVGKAFL